MKSIIFLSHLHDEHERGGAYLRNSALCSCLESWGVNIRTFYRGEFKLKSQRIKKALMGLRFGGEIRSLFTKSRLEVPECDAIIIDTFKYFSWDLTFRGTPPLRIYNAHNLEFENHYGKESSLKKEKFAKYEISRFEEMDVILVCSERERDIICTYNSTLKNKIFVFPNLVSRKRFEREEIPKKKLISFIGTLDYFPNIEAVKFLGENFFPRLPEELKSNFVIAGRRPTQEVRQICQKNGITLKLDLSEEDMSKHFLETDILLVPLVHGSGTRLKIIEGVLSGCRVVSTAIGAEGIESRNIIEVELEGFFDRFLEVYKDKVSQRSIDQDFLNRYELEAWSQLNKNKFLSFIEQKMCS